VGRVIVGKADQTHLITVALLADGHVLVDDVPGVAKTLLVRTVSAALGLSFSRVQCTADLLPADVTGSMIFDQRRSQFEFRPGPLFANLVLADEINRTTPKTQSALLEAMSEGRVSVDDRTYSLPRPFMVIATQNPIEYHGTYPLPESQLDRFMLRLRMGYPEGDAEKEILRQQNHTAPVEFLKPVLRSEDVLEAQAEVSAVRMDESLLDYILAVIQATRRSEFFTLGASPRAALALHRAAQGMAYYEGRDYCIPDDIKALVLPVLAHRVIVSSKYSSPHKRSEEAEAILAEILRSIEIPL